MVDKEFLCVTSGAVAPEANDFRSFVFCFDEKGVDLGMKIETREVVRTRTDERAPLRWERRA